MKRIRRNGALPVSRRSRLGTITGNPEAPVGLPEAFDDHMTITCKPVRAELTSK